MAKADLGYRWGNGSVSSKASVPEEILALVRGAAFQAMSVKFDVVRRALEASPETALFRAGHGRYITDSAVRIALRQIKSTLELV